VIVVGNEADAPRGYVLIEFISIGGLGLYYQARSIAGEL